MWLQLKSSLRFYRKGPERPDRGETICQERRANCGDSLPGSHPGTHTPLLRGAVHAHGTVPRVASILALRRVYFLEEVQTLLVAEMGEPVWWPVGKVSG